MADLSGVVYADVNANGAQDSGEPAVPGWTVYLDANHNLKLDAGETSTASGSDGSYHFTGLPTGNYLVAQVPRTGWTPTEPASPQAAALPAGFGPAPAATHYAAGPHAYPTRSVPNDPLFASQWHLRNTGQNGGTAGWDANVTPVWDTYKGDGVTIGIVDDGLQYTHPDLAPNYDAADSWNFLNNTSDPAPQSGDDHGTSVAGVAGAKGNNGTGVSGVAPNARLAGLRVVGDAMTDAREAGALSYHPAAVDIYSNSWGPTDDGETLEGPGPLALAALRDGATTGRGGKGNIYVWAAGNGLQYDDNVNYDGYANSRYTIAVTAIDFNGKQSYYAEPGAPILVSGYSNGPSGAGIVTTDRTGSAGYDSGDYTYSFGGTSSATPLVSGVVALMLQANPDLGWRDVQSILLHSTRKNDPSGSGWVKNGAGLWVNHKYGFGAVDAAAAVNLAKTWVPLGPETSVTSDTVTVNRTIPDNRTTGVTSSVTIDSLLRVESVEVVFTATHPYRGDLRVVLTSPDGTQSMLADVRGDNGDNYNAWTFTSMRHWDEIAKGTWTLKVTDEDAKDVGTFNSWRLNLYGTTLSDVQYVNLSSSGQSLAELDFGNQPPASPKVTAEAVRRQAAPNALAFTFDRDVAAVLSPADFEVRNSTTGQQWAGSQLVVAYEAGARTATVSVDPSALARGILPDGNYVARLISAGFSAADGSSLDGNGDGVPGDDHTFAFYQLAGDLTGDRRVGAADVRALYARLGTAATGPDQGDLDYDGAITFADYQLMELAVGKQLAAPAAPPEAPTAAPLASAAPATASSAEAVAPATGSTATAPSGTGSRATASRTVPAIALLAGSAPDLLERQPARPATAVRTVLRPPTPARPVIARRTVFSVTPVRHPAWGTVM